MHSPTWHVLGAGSIGSLFAARLHEAGLPVTMLLRDEATRIRRAADGLAVTWPDGQAQRHALPMAVAGSLPSRCLLVTTKTCDTLDALAPCLQGDGRGQLVLLLQNGMGTAEQVRARWPGVRLWVAVTTAGAWRAADGTVTCVATGDTRAGRLDDAGDPALDPSVQALCEAGLAATTTDIRGALWRKLAVNAVINALTALHGCRNGELLARDELARALPAIAAEVEAVAAAEGIAFDARVLDMAHAVIRQTAGNWSSMNRDVAAGRRTEIDAINGYVVARAQAHGIDVPANRALVDAIHAL